MSTATLPHADEPTAAHGISLVEIPVPSQVLTDIHLSAGQDVLVADHHTLGLREPLDAGQIVILHDLDGGHHGAQVVFLEFTTHTTLYHFKVGSRLGEHEARAVGAYALTRPDYAHVTTGDVLDALKTLAALGRREETCRQIDRQTTRLLVRDALRDEDWDELYAATRNQPDPSQRSA